MYILTRIFPNPNHYLFFTIPIQQHIINYLINSFLHSPIHYLTLFLLYIHPHFSQPHYSIHSPNSSNPIHHLTINLHYFKYSIHFLPSPLFFYPSLPPSPSLSPQSTIITRSLIHSPFPLTPLLSHFHLHRFTTLSLPPKSLSTASTPTSSALSVSQSRLHSAFHIYQNRDKWDDNDNQQRSTFQSLSHQNRHTSSLILLNRQWQSVEKLFYSKESWVSWRDWIINVRLFWNVASRSS